MISQSESQVLYQYIGDFLMKLTLPPEEFAADIKRQLEVVGQVFTTAKITRE
jgi:hypothetical protein